MVYRTRPLRLRALAIAILIPGILVQGVEAKMIADSKMIGSFAPASTSMTQRMVDGNDFLRDMTEATDSLKDYSFDYDTTVYKGNKTIDQKGQFWYKQQPKQLKCVMTGSFKKGAVAVLTKEGKVRGHLGGTLGAFVMTLSPDSDMLQGANGYPLLDSDFSSMCRVMQGFLKQGCNSKVSEHPAAVEGQQSKVYILEFYRGGSELYKRTYVDPQSLLPLEWFDYKDGRLFARTVWKNFKNDLHLSDDTFKI
jgi:outer membrane lipoprotein-sorting protein